MDYSREYCEGYVQRVLELYSAPHPSSTLVCLWMHCAGLLGMSRKTYSLDSILIEWDNMGCWNQQHVLFLMADHIEKLARGLAAEHASQARAKEPL